MANCMGHLMVKREGSEWLMKSIGCPADGYRALAIAALDHAKNDITTGKLEDWSFFRSGGYQLFTALADINDEIFRHEVATLALPVANKIQVKVSDIILFEGGIVG